MDNVESGAAIPADWLLPRHTVEVTRRGRGWAAVMFGEGGDRTRFRARSIPGIVREAREALLTVGAAAPSGVYTDLVLDVEPELAATFVSVLMHEFEARRHRVQHQLEAKRALDELFADDWSLRDVGIVLGMSHGAVADLENADITAYQTVLDSIERAQEYWKGAVGRSQAHPNRVVLAQLFLIRWEETREPQFLVTHCSPSVERLLLSGIEGKAKS